MAEAKDDLDTNKTSTITAAAPQRYIVQFLDLRGRKRKVIASLLGLMCKFVYRLARGSSHDYIWGEDEGRNNATISSKIKQGGPCIGHGDTAAAASMSSAS
ncbi:hypothetical protein U9M48_021480 [Paspalum notatum var. saurae]|uniref:Uncharacterized protein n=1 Tax=Paspalum notatum var. saurae TaxID=547442 RepID=A0AAQ3WTT1_PASNO